MRPLQYLSGTRRVRRWAIVSLLSKHWSMQRCAARRLPPCLPTSGLCTLLFLCQPQRFQAVSHTCHNLGGKFFLVLALLQAQVSSA